MYVLLTLVGGALINAGNTEEASEILMALDGYRDSRKVLAQLIDPKIELAGVGDYITFGAYNGKDPIEWLVLDKKGKRLLLISRYALTTRYTDSTWETSPLRDWLNGKFLDTAFSDAEQSFIRTVRVSAGKNPEYDTDPGKATQDKVFLLSIAETEKYFSSNDFRKCTFAEYATAGEGRCLWWLRSPGVNWSAAAIVSLNGSIGNFGANVVSNNVAVRPAMWIDLG